jgi:hypothetical protein
VEKPKKTAKTPQPTTTAADLVRHLQQHATRKPAPPIAAEPVPDPKAAPAERTSPDRPAIASETTAVEPTAVEAPGDDTGTAKKPGRDAQGRFQTGNAGGPGRPKGAATDFTVDQLTTFISAAKNPYAAAMLMRGGPELDDVKKDFPPHIIAAVERLHELGTLASDLLITRLRKRLEEER